MKIIAVVCLMLFGFAGCSKDKEHDTNNIEDKNVKSELIRDSNVNVPSLDANKDNKLFQCPMDEHYNVISDESGECPLCFMKLKEYSVQQTEQQFLNKKILNK